MAIRWNFMQNFSFLNRNFNKIYRFYVIETPVAGTSYRSITFKERGINLKKLNASLKRVSPFLKTDWYCVKQNEIEQYLIDNKMKLETDLSKEIIIHTLNSPHCSGKTDSMFYAIRCAFAHGAFDIHKYHNEIYYIFENKNRGVVKGRMIIKEKSLLEGIDGIEEESDDENL